MRLFIAIDIPNEIKERISGVARSFSRDGITLVKSGAYHITLQFLGERSGDELASIKDALSAISFEGFEIDMRGLSYFEPGFIKTIFVSVRQGSNEIRSIYNAINNELGSRIRLEEEHNYAPHLTIARVKRVRDKEALLSTIEGYATFEFGKFMAESVVLKESMPTEQGYVHRTLQEIKG